MDTTFPTTRSWHLDESKKVLRLMQELGIQAVVRRERRSKVTYPAIERVAENLFTRGFTAEKPN